MRRLSMFIIVLLAFIIGTPAFAQVGLEEGDQLRLTGRFSKQRVFSSAIDTINATANDTTGICAVLDHTDGLVFVYTVASGGVVSIDVLTQAAPAPGGPWITVARDTISATGSAGVDVTEFDNYRLPYVRLLADGIGSNAATTNFTALYVIATKLYPEDLLYRRQE